MLVGMMQQVAGDHGTWAHSVHLLVNILQPTLSHGMLLVKSCLQAGHVCKKGYWAH